MARGQTRNARGSSSTPRGGGRGKAKRKSAGDAGVPDVFREMLAEESRSGPLAETKRRPAKRRRIEESPAVEAPQVSTGINTPIKAKSVDGRSDVNTASESDTGSQFAPDAPQLQTIIDESEDSEESDIEFEEVYADNVLDTLAADQPAQPERGSISIVLGADKDATQGRTAQRRKGITAIERRIRYDAHKLHLLCLLGHMHVRNSWCNDSKIQATLRRNLTPKLVKFLNPDPHASQFQRHSQFEAGLKELSQLWIQKFKVTLHGLRRPHWIDGDALKNFKLPPDSERAMTRESMRAAASTLKGSPDTGATLLCALLRSAGVETRLTCSLQTLPLTGSTQPATPPVSKKFQKAIVYAGASSDDQGYTSDESGPTTPVPAQSVPKGVSKFGSARRRLGGASFMSPSTPIDLGVAPAPRTAPKLKTVEPPNYPVFWVEVFDSSHQKWIPIDPICTKTINRASRVEPPQNDPENQMAYVIVFEEDYIAKDVTRRYAKAYNAKTRKFRVESVEGGEKWFKKAMRIFRRRSAALDRDQVEDAELAKKEAAEGMPKNVQDFKDHPYYVLERHLKRNEVLHPRNEVGKVNTSSAANPKMESVFRRKDVHAVRTADKWYRLGRDVKTGEQPFKFAAPRRDKVRSIDEEPVEDEEQMGAGLYALYQTELYVPPPVVRGRVPRNAYGNLDIYVPSMIPAGGTHIKHPNAARAARLLGIDYADAVTGFQFKGRIGTAVVQGIIVATDNAEGIYTIIEGFEHAVEEAQERKRTAEALRLWKRFLIGLRIVERVKGYADPNEEVPDVRDVIDKEEDENEYIDAGGGFVPGDDMGSTAKPIMKLWDDGTSKGGLYVPEALTSGHREERSVRETSVRRKRIVLDDSSPPTYDPPPERREPDEDAEYTREDNAGGFMNDSAAGGFFNDTATQEDGPIRKTPVRRRRVVLEDSPSSTYDTSPKRQEPDEGSGFAHDDKGHGLMDNSGSGFIIDAVMQEGGGGFIPEADGGGNTNQPNITVSGPLPVGVSRNDDIGGGFMVEDAEEPPSIPDAPTTGAGFLPYDTGTSVISPRDDDMGGGFMVEDHAEENPPSTKSMDVTVSVREHQSVQEADHLVPNSPGTKASEDDKGSLLSHDPDDDDAEPDWLQDVDSE